MPPPNSYVEPSCIWSKEVIKVKRDHKGQGLADV